MLTLESGTVLVTMEAACFVSGCDLHAEKYDHVHLGG